MGQTPSVVEIAVRVVAGLIDLAERRAAIVARLSPAVAQAVAEVDPDGLRDTRPRWWLAAPGWPYTRLDPLDRLRLAHDKLVVLEAEAATVVADLRGTLGSAPVGSPERPHAYSPARAHSVLTELAGHRADILEVMRLAGRRLRPVLTPETAARLRHAVRALTAEERSAAAPHAALAALLASPPRQAA